MSEVSPLRTRIVQTYGNQDEPFIRDKIETLRRSREGLRIFIDMVRTLERRPDNQEPDFTIASWALKRAYDDGYNRAIHQILDLLTNSEN